MRAAERFPSADVRACQAADRFISAASALDDASYAAPKMFSVINLFLWHLDAFEKNEHPIPLFEKALDDTSKWLLQAGESELAGNYFSRFSTFEPDEQVIGEVFGEVYAEYTDDAYFAESHDLLRDRLGANDIVPQELFGGKTILEAGCGGGKFSAAIARMGAAKVIGIDIGEEAIAFAKSQAKKVPYGDRLDYRVGSVLDIPLPDESVDMVWSNSVIHLTDDWPKCFAEAYKVLKPGGILYVYVDGDFGLYDLLVWTLREVCRQFPIKLFHIYLKTLGVNTGRISWIIPTLYLPYAGKPRAEVEKMMLDSGFTDLRRLTRGVAIDQIEQVSAGMPYADIKYGDAQLKYLATKP